MTILKSRYNCSNHLGALELEDMGSFHIGGHDLPVKGKEVYSIDVNKNCNREISIDPNGTYSVGQMYIQYFHPKDVKGAFPLLLWHGGGMTGKTYESTPDGRPGWLNYFIRCGWKTYLCDSAERGRSGWNPYSPEFSSKPVLFNKEYIFKRFRLGESINTGLFSGSQFPIESFDMYAKEFVPRWVTSSRMMVEAYGSLLKYLGPSVIIAHSQGATLAFEVAERNPELIKALVLVEPYGAGNKERIEQIKGIPIYWIFGDYTEKHPAWDKAKNIAMDYCEIFCAKGGDGKILDLPAAGIYGNSHMLMKEKNNYQIADLIQDWLIDHKLYNV